MTSIGNTILHEVAGVEKSVTVARKILEMEPKLLSMSNKHGETALFRAAAYGRTEMFEYLDNEINKIFVGEGPEEVGNYFLKRNDKSTILHASIISDHFELALSIAKRYKHLVVERDGDGMTPLQLLACNQSAFKRARKLTHRLLHSCVSLEGTTMTERGKGPSSSCYGMALSEAIRKKNKKYESALELAEFLIAKDTSWHVTLSAINQCKPKCHRYGKFSSASQGQSTDVEGLQASTTHGNKTGNAETPLFLATKLGIIEIVEQILKKYPQAAEHIDHHGRNILHIAIKYRQIHIFDFLEKKMEISMMRLIQKIDNNGNSVLHTVALRPDGYKDEKMRSPALVLQEDLLLFERLNKIYATLFTKHFNNDRQTAKQLFVSNNALLHKEAIDWLKRTAENCSIVAVLIATVAFAAAYTIPGGPSQTTGYPILLDQPFFVVFTMTDVLSLTLALTSVIVFLSILTSPFRFKDFKCSLPQKLMLGITLLILSVSMMMLAFGATVILMIHNKERWTKLALYLVAFLPVSVFALTYLPLYLSLMRTSSKYLLRKIGEAFRWCRSESFRSGMANSLKYPKSRARIDSNPNQPQTTSSTSCSCPLTTPQTNHSLV
ncbi:ankyrin repeat-containing protein ITN1-like isoform X1 [Camellia sinensis]|uniref:ankyrin repeat-containing protein ITN1-like isoform X1 n=1 Tax=Camellia sinensis TaxID=4442 RepID=UPI0010365FF8|nr:ankyrin repeat-containing protein ITN1-like isoform X1 [Camellia sinensis]